MKHEIKGDELQVALITLDPGETLVMERGGMGWMSPNLSMDTKAQGGLMKSIGRMASGESLFLNKYTNNSSNTGIIACPSSFPGKIYAKQLDSGEALIAQKKSFLCAESTVEISIHLRKNIGVGFFGGEGFIMQKFVGPGWVFLEIDGCPIHYTLQQGQQLKIDPGHIAMHSPSVTIDIATVKGLKNIALGGEGLFIATATGPGDIWLQTMTIAKFAQNIIPYMPSPSR